MEPINPRSNLSISGNQTLPFSASGTYVNIHGWVQLSANDGLWGPKQLESFKGKAILLLPPAFNYVSENWQQWYKETLESTVIENYKNTGRTAVIYDIPSLIPSQDNSRAFGPGIKIEATKYASRGNNAVDLYFVYDDNSAIKPIKQEQNYIDELDLDDDGDRNEVFARVRSYINYIPPLELSIKKQVGYDSNDFGLITTGDLGSPILYKLTIFNNTIADATHAHIIDVLPYVGDHSISPNQAGEYIERGSTFSVPLIKAIEDVEENKDVLSLFDFFYQVVPQGSDLSSVRDGKWLTKEEITDWSTVKSFKISLKKGQVIKSKQEVNIIVPSMLPKDPSIQSGTFAINSASLSTDGYTYSDGNVVKATYVPYSVDGVFFRDFNEDGLIGDDEDILSGRTVKLYEVVTREDGKEIEEPAKDLTDKEYVTRTDSNGAYHFDVYKRGRYVVRFAKSENENYTSVTNKDVKGNSVDSEGTSYKFSLNPVRASAILNAGVVTTVNDLTIKKVDSEDSTHLLTGATFAIYEKGKDTALQTVTTDKNGEATFTGLAFGEYEIQEVTAPTGYELKDKRISVSVEKKKMPVLEIQNTAIKRDLVITKTDDGKNLLSEVGFTLYRVEDDKNEVQVGVELKTDAKGIVRFEKLPFGNYIVKETTTPVGYLKSEDQVVTIDKEGKELSLTIVNPIIKGTVTVTKVDADDNSKVLPGVTFGLYQGDEKKYEAVTDDSGVATFQDVVYGDYTLKEIRTLPNYTLSAETKPVSVTEEGKTVAVGNITNQIIKGTVTVTKVDADDNSKVLQGVTFGLYQGDEKKYEAVTDDSGVATFQDVVYGDYTLKEIRTLPNYTLSAETKPVSVTEEGKTVAVGNITNQIIKGTVTVTKVDADDNSKVLQGVTFGLYQGDEKKYEAVTDDSGVATFQGVVYGDYTLKEIHTLPNYILSEETKSVSVTEEGKTVAVGNITNQIIKGTVTVTKVDAEDNSKVLQGVTFGLYQGDEKKYEVVTDDSGVATFQGVVYGEYSLKEVRTLDEYVLSSEVKTVEIVTEGQSVDAGIVENQKVRGSIVLRKIDGDTKQVLEGVEFTLYRPTGEAVQVTTSDKNGLVRFDNVEYGNYIIRETKTLANYNLSDEIRNVFIREHGVIEDLGDYSNKLIRGHILLQKVDEETKQPLQGVEFTLYNKSGDALKTVVSNAQGFVRFDSVDYGSYVVKETKPLSSYIGSDKDYDVAITTNQEVIDLGKIENKKLYGSVQLTKIDKDSQSPLSGVVFGIYDSDKHEIATGMTDKNGQLTFTKLEYGKYSVEEIRPLKGYQELNKKLDVQIQSDGHVVNLGMIENERIRGSVQLTKIDKDSQSPLSGVIFGLYDSKGKEISKAMTDSKGELAFSDVPHGEYLVREIEPLAGYQKLDKAFEVKIEHQNQLVNLGKIENQLLPKEKTGPLPSTGYTNSWHYMMIGLFFLFSCLFVKTFRYQKHEFKHYFKVGRFNDEKPKADCKNITISNTTSDRYFK